MLLIVTNREDLASDFLILRLRERGIPFVRFNTEDFPSRAAVRIDNAAGQWRWAIEVQGKRHDDFEFSGVYLRHPEIATLDHIVEGDREFAGAEVAETLRSLWRVIPDRLWLNHPRQVWLASNKVMQLMVAGDLGFRVPPTLVTNDPEAIKEFAQRRRRGEVVAKAVRHGFVRDKGRTLLAGTQPFAPEKLEEEDVAQGLPIQIQSRIIKKSDVRVVVVDRDVFATRIHPSETSESHVDWRIHHLRGEDLRHEVATLPADLETLCRQLPRRFGLRYSSMDLLEDRNGEFWFLELNPNGQWAWIEQLTGQGIRDSIIRAFGI